VGGIHGVGGRRGSAFSTRAAGYGAFGGPAHTARSNAGVALVLMVETPEAVAQAGAIAAVPGVDAVFIGPNDLSHAMGHENRWGEAAVQAVIAQGLRDIHATGCCAGTLALNADDESRYAAHGARLFATVSTSLITQALQAAAQGARPTLSY
jgi:4-hydroxy-2-oxoheptanedioate aldolase